MNIQWYPGHMTKTRRQMAEYIKQVDAVCEVVDARIPQVSRNPDMDEIAAGRPRMMILNRIDLADPNKTAVWAKHFRDQGMAVIQTDSRAGTGTQAFSNAVRTLLADKIEQWNEKGLVGKAVRVMELLSVQAPQTIVDRSSVSSPEEECDVLGDELLQQAGKRRGFLLRGGEIDTERMARILLDEFRGGVLGRITLEMPAAAEQGADA